MRSTIAMAKGLWVILNVGNVDKSLEFYKGLGLKAKRANMGGMTWGDVTLGPEYGFVLMDKNQIAPGQAPDTAQWLSGELGKGILLVIGVPDARRTWEKAQTIRATVDQPLREQEWGGREFSLVDPDGYVLNIADKLPGAEPKPKKTAKKVAKKAKGAAKKAKGAAKKTAKKSRRR